MLLGIASVSLIAADGSGFSGVEKFVEAGSAAKPRAVCLVIPAEYVSFTVRIVNEQKGGASSSEETQQAINLLRSKARDKYEVTIGIDVLRPDQGYNSSFWSSSSSRSSTEIYLLAPVGTNAWSIFEMGAGASLFLNSLNPAGKIRFDLVRARLAVSNPEKHRRRLLQMISDEVRRTRESLAPNGGMRISGLESPVQVAQLDDKNVALFLEYSLSVSEGEQQGH